MRTEKWRNLDLKPRRRRRREPRKKSPIPACQRVSTVGRFSSPRTAGAPVGSLLILDITTALLQPGGGKNKHLLWTGMKGPALPVQPKNKHRRTDKIVPKVGKAQAVTEQAGSACTPGGSGRALMEPKVKGFFRARWRRTRPFCDPAR